jgi:hypothetical protein
MKKLDHPLIANIAKRQLSALGYKQLNRIKGKAAEINRTNKYSLDFKPIGAQVEQLVYSLIFDHNITKEQLSLVQKSIKVINNTLQMPQINGMIIL